MGLKDKYHNRSSFSSNIPVFAIIIILIVAICFSPALVELIQKRFLKNNASILIIPGYYSKRFSGIVLLLAFLAGILIHVNLKELREMKNGIKTRIQDKFKFKIGFSILGFVMVFFLYMSICFAGNFIEIFKNRIISHNCFLMKTNVYDYSRVKSVKIGYYIGLQSAIPEYILKMDNGEELNIAANGMHTKLFYDIDTILPDSVARECTIDGKSRIIDKMPSPFREYYYKKYIKQKP